jgi:hypothetical protein
MISMLLNPTIKHQSLHFPIRLPLSLRRSLFRQYSQIPQLNCNLFNFQYAFLSNTSSFITSQKSNPSMRSNFQEKNQSSVSNTHSFVTSQKSIPPMLLNPTIKNLSFHFPIRIPLSLRRSLLRQCAQISN